ncbi:hypothetical protein BJX64DRAFT_233006 [Aspergillus heterothallicus]
MESTIEKEGNRTSVSSQWGSSYSSTQTRAFKNPGILCYRNAVLLVLLHNPLLLNWIEDVHLARHSCGTTNMSLLCSLHYLIGFYWFGDTQKDTHEICMERVWKKLLETTWADVDLNERQNVRHFLGALLKQLSIEMKIDAEKYWELQRIVCVGLKTRLVCKDCGIELPLEDEKLFVRASFPEINGQPPWYEVAEAIQHNLEQATLPWTCDDCAKSNNYNSSAEPNLSTKHIEKLPEILFIQVDHYSNRGQLNGLLKIEDTLVVSKDLRYPDGAEEGDIRYELYSIIFHKQSGTDDEYVTAAKGPAGKWALIYNDFVTDELSLDKLLDTIDSQQRAHILAYQRLPLNGEPPRLASNLKLIPPTPIQSRTITPTKQDGQSTPVSQGTTSSGVTLEQIINVRDGVEWTVKQQLPFPIGVDRLLDLKGRVRTQRTRIRLTLTSPDTGEILEGEVFFSLMQKNRRKAKARDGPPKKRGRPLGSKTGSGLAKKAELAPAKNPDLPLVTILGVPEPGQPVIPNDTTVSSGPIQESQQQDHTEEPDAPIVITSDKSSPEAMDIDTPEPEFEGPVVPDNRMDIQRFLIDQDESQ